MHGGNPGGKILVCRPQCGELMVDKIFYSWQSDASNTTNRNFIEDALFKAVKELGRSDDELYEPPRDVELDKDTKDVPGQPPIADTIFRKIEDCAVFVADMTFVSKTEAGRLSPNPNVLIEYGWALAKCGHRRIVTVMNTAHGEPNETKLPFDLRHYRWPINTVWTKRPMPKLVRRRRRS
jgi:hypothetical protein